MTPTSPAPNSWSTNVPALPDPVGPDRYHDLAYVNLFGEIVATPRLGPLERLHQLDPGHPDVQHTHAVLDVTMEWDLDETDKESGLGDELHAPGHVVDLDVFDSAEVDLLRPGMLPHNDFWEEYLYYDLEDLRASSNVPSRQPAVRTFLSSVRLVRPWESLATFIS